MDTTSSKDISSDGDHNGQDVRHSPSCQRCSERPTRRDHALRWAQQISLLLVIAGDVVAAASKLFN